MDYQKHYDRLIETRKSRESISGEYYENHHIIMKSMGGTNDSDNLIKLTAREHFLAHWLLWKIHKNRQTAYAFATFTSMFRGKNHKNRPKITSSRGYAEAREAYSRIHSEKLKGQLNSNRSKIVIQMDINGNFINEWPSAKEAERTLGFCHISSCCRGERSYAGGFTWKYKSGIIKKSKPYKERKFTKKNIKTLTKANLENISRASSGRNWYNDGIKDYFLKPYTIKEGLILGRLATRKENRK